MTPAVTPEPVKPPGTLLDQKVDPLKVEPVKLGADGKPLPAVVPDPLAVTFDQIKEAFPKGSELNPEDPIAKDFLTTLNNKDLTPADRGKALVGIYTKIVEQITADNVKAWGDMNAVWQGELVKEFTQPVLDTKLGQVGALIESYDQSINSKLAAGAPRVEAGKALREAATLTGFGNNPTAMKFMFWIADQLGEGRPLGGGQPAGGEQSRAQKMFPTQT